MIHDIFISHANEDKKDFVGPLAKMLRDNHVEVWYDAFSLKPGDSIRRSIDIGIAKSRYGIVVLSNAFFKKEWTQWELDGLVQRLNRSKTNMIIPIWHDISRDEVMEYSPSLADRQALMSHEGIEHVVAEIIKIVKPEGSTLLAARDILIDYGVDPPVVTDDWWLDVVAFSEVDHRSRYWGFPLPGTLGVMSITSGEFSIAKPSLKQQKIAWAAMQWAWQLKRKERNISQISRPEEILDFIKNSPGLEEVCHNEPDLLAVYAPQLTIPGFGGPFENDFEKADSEYLKDWEGVDVIWHTGYRYALRHPKFANLDSTKIVNNYISGEIASRVHAEIDCLLWFLSSESAWMPRKIHQYMLEGFKSVDWQWHAPIDFFGQPLNNGDHSTGYLSSMLQHTQSFENFVMTEKCIYDLEERIKYAKQKLHLPETVNELYQQFMDMQFIQNWFITSTNARMVTLKEPGKS